MVETSHVIMRDVEPSLAMEMCGASSRPNHHQASFPFQMQAFILLEQKRTTSLAYSFNITLVFNRLVLVACYIYWFELLPVLVMRYMYI